MWDMNFKTFLPNSLTEVEIANLYFHSPYNKVKDIAKNTGKSVAEVYRIIHKYGKPNRQVTNHENVVQFFDAGLSIPQIAELTGYTPRNVRYITKKTKDE